MNFNSTAFWGIVIKEKTEEIHLNLLMMADIVNQGWRGFNVVKRFFNSKCLYDTSKQEMRHLLKEYYEIVDEARGGPPSIRILSHT